MTPTDPTEGSTAGHVVLGGKYVLGDILGTGGTYTVYEATRIAPAAASEAPSEAPSEGASKADGDAEAAPEPLLLVKVLHPHLVDDEAARAALAREIAASDQVDHPGVTKVLDTGEDEVAGANVPWLLCRRLPGVPLSELAADDGLPWQEALTVVSALLDGLAAVHAAGLVHRDVSPRNVVVERHDDGTVEVGLLDLGLAAPAGGDGDGELVTGSAVCMSPEQAQGRPLDARSDLYSAGALAYFALTGHAPYERARPADVLRAHVEAPVPAPSARRAGIPVTVDRFVARAMAKNPARRFASAEAMSAGVATLLGTRPGIDLGAAAGGTSGAGRPRPDRTMSLDQVDTDDPHRTAFLGAAGGAAVGAAAAGDPSELERTRQLGAVPPSDEGPDGAAADPAAPWPPDQPEPAEPEQSRWRAFLSNPKKVTLAVIVLLLLLGGGAFAIWSLGGADDELPVVPVTQSPSPSPSVTPSETATPEQPTSSPTSRPRPTETTEPTPTPTPSPTPTPTPSPTPSETTEPTPTPTPTPEPTETETTEPPPTSSPEPTETETTEPTDPAPEPTETTGPGETAPPGDPEDDGSGDS